MSITRARSTRRAATDRRRLSASRARTPRRFAASPTNACEDARLSPVIAERLLGVHPGALVAAVPAAELRAEALHQQVERQPLAQHHRRELGGVAAGRAADRHARA